MYKSLRKFMETLSGEKPLSIAVGLSGGADSVALAYLLQLLKEDDVVGRLTAIHFDHHLRGKESERDREFVISFCRAFHIRLLVEDLNVTEFCQQQGVALEEGARLLRYNSLADIVNREKIDYCALGHHRNDQIETVLFNLFRGSGLTGLSAMRKISGPYIRPLLDVGKAELLTYLKEKGLAYCEDGSNKDNDVDRNKIRNIIIPRIEELLHRNIGGNILNLSTICSEVIEFSDSYLDQLLAGTGFVKSFSPCCFICLSEFNRQKVYLRRQILNRILQQLGFAYNIDFKKSNILLDFITSGSSETISFYGFSFSVYRNNIIVGREQTVLNDSHFALPVKTTLLYQGIFSTLQLTDKQRSTDFYYGDINKLKGPLRVEKINKGARFIPFGKSKPVKISRILNDKKIPVYCRDKLFMICDTEKVIYIEGIGTDNRIKVDADSSSKIYFNVENNLLRELF